MPGVRRRNFLNHRYDVAAHSPYLGRKVNAVRALRGEAGGGGGDGTHQVMMYCMCSFLRVTLVCPPTGPPGTVLSAETVGSVLDFLCHQLLGT